MVLTLFASFTSYLEQKRKIYDQYGKEGLVNGGAGRYHADSAQFFNHNDFASPFGAFFSFRDPEDVFREFFGGDPFADMFGGRSRGQRSNRQSASLRQNNLFGFPSFGFGLGFPDIIADPNLSHGVTSFTTFSTSNFDDFASRPGVKRTTTSTKYLNGKKVETRK